METKTFLEKVWPTSDFYTLWIKNSGNYSFADLDSCVSRILVADKGPNDVYFAIGKHNVAGRRTKETSTWFKTLSGDIDVGAGKPYQTQRDAGRALISAVKQLSLPDPMIVSSGYGLHFYFPLTVAIRALDWERLSTALYGGLDLAGLKLDTGKISDRSMVLRPVGTHNKKDPSAWKEVRCLQDANAVDPRELLMPLTAFLGAPRPAAHSTTDTKSTVSAAVLNSGGDFNPVPFEKLAACGQIAALMTNKGATASEPLWRASLGIAKFCTEPEAVILALASGYPGFDLAENWRKLHSWKGTGPPTCKHFEDLNRSGCDGCPVRGKITTPTALASQTGENLADPYLAEIKFPRGYFYTGSAIMHKVGDEEPTFVSHYLMYPIQQYTDAENRSTTVKVRVKYPIEGWRTVDLEHTALTSDGKDFNNWLYAKRLWTHDGGSKHLRSYLLTYLRELTHAVQTSLLYDHYGWQDDGSFLAGDKLVTVTGLEDIQHSKLATQFSNAMTPTGDLSLWSKGTALFDVPDLHFHGFAFLMGLAGPLMIGANLEALLVNMYSPDSGSGKTVTGMYALSAWGNPEKLFLTVRDTDNALYKTLGTLSSTCAYIDEITTIDPRRLCDVVYSVTQGRERIRMRRDTSLYPPATWKMPILSSSNQDLYEVVDMQTMTEAQQQRILQLPMHRVSIFDQGGKNLGYKITKMLKENHGLAGIEIAKELIRLGGKNWVMQRYNYGLETIEEKYQIKFRGPERFAQAAVVMADMIGELGKRLGIVQFNYERSIYEVAKHLTKQREFASANRQGPVDVISQYLTENASNVVVYCEYRFGNKTTPRVIEPVPRNAVARMELVIREPNTVFAGGFLYINRAMFRRWAKTRGIDYSQLLSHLSGMGVKYNDDNRYTLYKGVFGMGGVGQTRCLMIDLSSHIDFARHGAQAMGSTNPIRIEDSQQETSNGA
jgi:hypothetical protein